LPERQLGIMQIGVIEPEKTAVAKKMVFTVDLLSMDIQEEYLTVS